MKAKKVLAMLMASAMIMGTTVTAFAADTATITVSGLDSNATYKYLQVVEQDTTSTIGWKFVDGYADEFMAAFNVNSDEDALRALIAIGTGGNSYAESGTINPSTDLNEALTSLTDEVRDYGIEAESSAVTVDKAGLYVIVASTTDESYTYVPMMAYVEDAGSGDLQDADVVAKGSHNVIDKNLTSGSTDESVSEGDIVEFTATVVYPFFTPDSAEHTFTITDTLTNGTFVDGSVEVSIVGSETTPSYTTNEYGGTNALTIDFSNGYDSTYAGKTLTIKYDARVGAGEGDVKNDIKTNLDPNGDSVTLDRVNVKVLKTGKDNAPLVGATFEIYEAGTQETEEYIKYENVSVFGEEDTKTLFLKKIAEDITAGQDGSITFGELDADKTYYVKETNAPLGYTVNPNYYPVGKTTKNEEASDDDLYVYNDFANITVTDSNLSSLPSTGGIGTTIFTIGGCVIMVTAAGLYFATRKKEQN